MQPTMRLPCVIMRGGTSRGPYLLATDLPTGIAARDGVLLALMGSGHGLQVDGIGGANPQTSKVAIVSRSTRPGVDVDYLFAQVGIETRTVDTRPNCGNMLAGVGPFAIEAGLVAAAAGTTLVRIHNVNTSARIDAVVQTPGGQVSYDGDTAIPGVPGTGAAIELRFSDFVGAKTGRLLPTGNAREAIEGIDVTLIDSAVPMLLLRAADLGLTAIDDASAIEADTATMVRIERMRCEAGRRMGLGDVAKSVIPKVGLLAPAPHAHLAVAYLMPWQVHKSLAVTGAVCLATAATVPGTVAQSLTGDVGSRIEFAHPSGHMPLALTRDGDRLAGVGVIRTARRLFEGHALVPAQFYQHTA